MDEIEVDVVIPPFNPSEEAVSFEYPVGFLSPTPMFELDVLEFDVKRRVVDGEAEDAMPGWEPLLDRDTALFSF